MNNYIDTELGKIPSDWEIKEIGEIGEVITGNTPKTSELENYGEEYLFVSPIDMGRDKYISKTNKMLSSVGFTKTRRLPKGSVLVTCIGSTIGKIGIASKELCTNQQINSIVCSNIINNEYVYYAIHYNFKHYKNFISNQAVPIINKTTFSKLPLQIPSLKEQQKITTILSSIDEAIGKTEAIIEQTGEVKKGLMQQLLTQGVGHTKFKKTEIGEIPESWSVVKVEEICDVLDGLRKPIKKADRVLGDIPYYGATGVIDWVNDYIFDESLVLVGEDGENIRSRVLPMAFKIEGKSWVNNHAHVLRPKDTIDIDYLELYLEFIDYEKYITGSAQPKLNQQVLRKIKVALPRIEEQKMLSRSMSAIANKLQKEEEKLLQLQVIKKGLMQSLLTGRVRVKIDKDEVTQV
ncbi:restriction endonuclease subunit S [Bacillus mobilis]|uniref:restriction endonuclease subunit S n=1 Tax=Bacillus mobilis TaxID=2026190 RepID=UPI003CF076C1